MNTMNCIFTSRLGRLVPVIAVSIAASLPGCASDSPNYRNQVVFKSPEDAAKRLTAAVSAGNTEEIETIFGTDSRATLSSGDPVADRRNRQIMAVALMEKWKLEPLDSTTQELVIGDEAWPFPIPLVKDARGWWFDTVAGKVEVVARRVGRNELSTIETLRTYVVAQREYAAAGRDGKPAGIFAQQIRSDTGKHNGLYWPSASVKEMPSPLGALVAGATAEGYSTQTKEGTAPYHGYFYRILKKQGAAATGGAKDYLVKGEMTGGFGMIAFPAEYGSSGIMSFMVGPDGIVYQSDLGDDTKTVAGKIEAYNPSAEWQRAD